MGGKGYSNTAWHSYRKGFERTAGACHHLKSGLPLHTGMLNFFDKADNAFISAYRKHHRDGTFEIELDYVSCPSLENRILIICDPICWPPVRQW